MVTKVGKQIFALNAGNSVFPQTRVTDIGWVPGRTINSDTTVYFGYTQSSHTMNWLSSVNNTNSAGVAFGSGTTPATNTDYNMESIIPSTGISVVATTAAQAYDSETQNTFGYVNYTITNNSENDLTISEIGLFATLRATGTSGTYVNNNVNYSVMLEHTILDNPVTIPAGEAGIIQYRFEFPLE